MAQTWKKNIRILMRQHGHQPASIVKESKDSSIYHGGCRRCDIKVTVDTLNQTVDINTGKLNTTLAWFRYPTLTSSYTPPTCIRNRVA